jgi:ubiquitin C-terminal hydrolase
MEINFSNNAGLVNFGPTCFMNASIQILMCARIIGSFLMFSEKHFSDSDIIKYIQTWKDYMNPDTKILGPKILYHRYMVLNKNYIGFTQEDSHEFLTFTLDDIIEQIKNSLNNSNLNQSQKDEILNEFTKIFKIKFNQTVYYKNKNETSKTDIFENILTLPLASTSSDPETLRVCQMASDLTLEDCVKLYCNQEEDDFKLSYEFIDMPKYLFVGLKRFKVTQVFIQKITTDVEIPFETCCFDDKTTYVLKGFIIHAGGVTGGHYYSYGSRKIDSKTKWFCYNDTNVSEVSMDQVIAESKKAYMFLYSRR